MPIGSTPPPNADATPPPSGWYVYPDEPGDKQRYWDGREWKGKVRKRGFVASAQPFPVAKDTEAPSPAPAPPRPAQQETPRPTPPVQREASKPAPPPSGWYVYPDEPGEKQRYWDGREWKGKVRKRGFVASAQPFPQGGDPEGKPHKPVAEPSPSVTQPPPPGTKRPQPVAEPAPSVTKRAEPPSPRPAPVTRQSPQPVSQSPQPPPAAPQAPAAPVPDRTVARPVPDLNQPVREEPDQGEARRRSAKEEALQELGYWHQRAAFLSQLHAESLARVMTMEERCRLAGVTDREMQRRLEGLVRPTEPFRGPQPPLLPAEHPAQSGPKDRGEREDGAARETAGANGHQSGDPGAVSSSPAPEAAKREEAAPAAAAAPGRFTRSGPGAAPEAPSAARTEAPSATRTETPPAHARPETPPAAASAPSPFEPTGSRPQTSSGSSRRAQLFESLQLLRASARAARKRRAGSRR